MKMFIEGILLLLILNACSEHNEVGLISFNSKFITEDSPEMDSFYIDRSVFIEPYVSTSYVNDEMVVAKTLQRINACGKTEGTIKLSNDTIWLLTEHVSGNLCTSIEYHLFEYKIKYSDIKKYKIMY